jgi:Rad3-related DNA helicase
VDIVPDQVDLLSNQIALELKDVLAKFSKAKVRPYQKKCIEEIITALSNNKDAALLLPTGMGKSFIYLPLAIAAVDKGYRVCVLCATNLLIDQTRNNHMPSFKVKTPPKEIIGLKHYECKIRGTKADYVYCAEEHTKSPDQICTCDLNRGEFEKHGFIVSNFAKFVSTPFKNKFDLVIIDDSHGFENVVEDRFQTHIAYDRIEELFQRHDQQKDAVADVAGAFLDVVDNIFSAIPPDETTRNIPEDEVKKMAEVLNFADFASQLKDLGELDRNIGTDLLYFIKNCQNLTQHTFYVQKDFYNPQDVKEATITSRKSDNYINYVMNLIFGDSRVLLVSAFLGNVEDHASYCTHRSYQTGDLVVVPTQKPSDIKSWFKNLSIFEVANVVSSTEDAFDECVDLTTRMLQESRVKSLLLFKNYRDQRRAEIGLKREVRNREITFIDDTYEAERVQALVEKADVIMASASSRLWEGINIGNLKLEVIFSLPFIRPPVYMDKTRSYPFVKRKMLIRLQQGIGRVIRNPKDSGVCVVLDYANKPTSQTKLSTHVTSHDFSPELRERITQVTKEKVCKEVATRLRGE